MRIITEFNRRNREKRSDFVESKVFLQDNASVHTSAIAMTNVNKLKFELLPHAPHSPDLIPSDYFLVPNWKK